MSEAMGGTAALFEIPNSNASLASSGSVFQNSQVAIVASAKFYNREDLARRLNWSFRQSEETDDLQLLAAIYLKWGPDCFGIAIGDITALIFDVGRKMFVCWRSAGSNKDLFYANGPSWAVAASTPYGVLAHPDTERNLNFSAAAVWAAALPSLGGSTLFKDVHRILPGQAISFLQSRGVQEIWRYRPKRQALKFRSIEEAGEALSDALDRAVHDRLAPIGAKSATHLSSGRDSAAVTTSAARLLKERQETLLALTGVPFGNPPTVSDRFANETRGAARVAATASNIEHVLCCYKPGSFISRLTDLHRHCFQPLGNVSNMPWWTATLEEAQRHGAKVLLKGAAGNLTISAGGRDHISDVVRVNGWVAALRLCHRNNGYQARAWLGSLHALFGPYIPPALYRNLIQALGRFTLSPSIPILREPHRSEAERHLRETWPDPRPNRSGFAWRSEQLSVFDPGDMVSREVFGIEERDPTLDPRVVDLTLSVPPEFLLPQRNNPRPLYTAAFGDRLPKETLLGGKRGYQGADWYLQFPLEAVQARFELLLEHPLNAELFDCRFILENVPRRPRARRNLVANATLDLHRNMLLGALSIADWIAVHFPGR